MGQFNFVYQVDLMTNILLGWCEYWCFDMRGVLLWLVSIVIVTPQ